MNIRCRQCNSQFNIPDHKLPKDKAAVFNCPKCREKIHIPADGHKASGTPGEAGAFGGGPDNLFERQERALILVSEGPFLQAVVSAARQLGYGVETAADPAEAVKKMAYHVYPLVVLEDRFDPGQETILAHMNTLDMSVRRKICLVLAGQTFKSGDPMAALHASVNLVAGPDSLSHMPGVLSAALMEHGNFYRVYMDSMKAAGKA
jgi:predicted Zn finger-like uncharacterized protein